jgi:hypothetical protein
MTKCHAWQHEKSALRLDCAGSVWGSRRLPPRSACGVDPPTTPGVCLSGRGGPIEVFQVSAGCGAVATVGKASQPPAWIKPQLTRVVDEAPGGDDSLHEIKYDGYRMHARLVDGKAQLLTRTGLDWSKQYGFTVEALRINNRPWTGDDG